MPDKTVWLTRRCCLGRRTVPYLFGLKSNGEIRELAWTTYLGTVRYASDLESELPLFGSAIVVKRGRRILLGGAIT